MSEMQAVVQNCQPLCVDWMSKSSPRQGLGSNVKFVYYASDDLAEHGIILFILKGVNPMTNSRNHIVCTLSYITFVPNCCCSSFHNFTNREQGPGFAATSAIGTSSFVCYQQQPKAICVRFRKRLRICLLVNPDQRFVC